MHRPTVSIAQPTADAHRLRVASIYQNLNGRDTLVYRDEHIYDEFGQEVVFQHYHAVLGQPVYRSEVISRHYPNRIDQIVTQTYGAESSLSLYAELDLDSVVVSTWKADVQGLLITTDSTLHRRTHTEGTDRLERLRFVRPAPSAALDLHSRETLTYTERGPVVLAHITEQRIGGGWLPNEETLIRSESTGLVGTFSEAGHLRHRWTEPPEAWPERPAHLVQDAPFVSPASGEGAYPPFTVIATAPPPLWDRTDYVPSADGTSWDAATRTRVERDSEGRPTDVVLERFVPPSWSPFEQWHYSYGEFGVTHHRQLIRDRSGIWQPYHEQTYTYNSNGTLDRVDEWTLANGMGSPRTIYRLEFEWETLSATASVQTELPTTSHLAQNYPNPFHHSTHFQVKLPASDYILLNVYSVLGQRVAVVYEGLLAAGTHTFVFDASQLPSGPYTYRLMSSTGRPTRQMLLLK
ncbi:MAG: hypothetical protein RhofKO_15010 [Rhodothermales bacterium]